MKNYKKLAIIGLDGLGWDTLLPLIKRDYLPNLKLLLKSSYIGTLKCIPPLTPPSWTLYLLGLRLRNMAYMISKKF